MGLEKTSEFRVRDSISFGSSFDSYILMFSCSLSVSVFSRIAGPKQSSKSLRTGPYLV